MPDLIVIFLGALSAVLLTEVYERVLKRPTIDITIGKIADGEKNRFLHILVTNVERFGIRRALRSNNSSEQVKAQITFVEPSTESSIASFTGRWSSKAEPLEAIDYLKGKGSFSPALAKDAETEFLLPGESKQLTVALKYDNEDSFYGFNNWSYLNPGWKNPKFRVTLKSAHIKVELFTPKFKKTKIFEITNPNKKRVSFKIKPIRP